MDEFSSQEPLGYASKPGVTISKARLALIVVGVCGVTALVVGLAVYYGHPDKGKGVVEDMTTMTTMAPPAPTTTPPASADSPILPSSVVPQHYELKLRPDMYGDKPEDFMFNGSVLITVSVREATKMVTLHQRDLTIEASKLTVKQQGNDENIFESVSEDKENEFYTIHVKRDLIKDQNYDIYLEFEGPLRNDLKGLYWSTYTEGTTTKYITTSQLQATDARKTFPCFDEPALKATFGVTLERRRTHATMCNMEISSTETLNDDWAADIYNPTPVMSSYLLAFLIHDDFVCKNKTTKTGKPVYICARSSAQDQTEYANEVAAPIQDFLEEYHAIEYPLDKTVHVAIPDFSAGAMENWGLIMYRETALLYDDQASSAAYRQRVAYVIAHELAHMWFGNIVTCEWWDDIWLNEGFASYMENLGVDSQYLDTSNMSYWQMEGQFLADALQTVLVLDGGLTSHPVYQPVNHPDEISQVFDTIAYDKGSSIIRMINYFMGEDNFKRGLTNYLNENKYGVTTHTQLFDALTKEAEVDVASVMNTWILQMGYPVVTFNLTGSSDVTVTQKRFLYKQPDSADDVQDSAFGYKWIVPLTVFSDQSTEDAVRNPALEWLQLHEKSKTISTTGSPTWIIGNVGQRFYYRVNYDESNWASIFNQLKTDHTKININNRAQIIDDAFNLGRAGEIPQVRALEAIEYMSKPEEEYVPWRTLQHNIYYMKQMLQSSEAKDNFTMFMRTLVEEAYNTVGWNETEDVDLGHLSRRLRPVILSMACSYGNEDCLSTANGLYSDWMGGTILSPNLATAVYCYGISAGGSAEWDFALEKYKVSNVGSEQILLLQSLGCASDETLLQNYLNMLLDGAGLIRDQDVGTVMAAVSRNPKGTDMAWDFFKQNWKNYFYPKFGSVTFRLASIISVLTESFSTEEKLQDLEAFMEANPEQGTGAQAFKQAVETVNTNIQWKQENEEEIKKWLAKI